MMKKKEVIVRSYDPERRIAGIALWAIIVGLLAMTLFLPMTLQSMDPSRPHITSEKIISPWDYLIFIIVAVAVTIILAKTDMFGGLSNRDRELLRFLYLNEKEEFNRYQLSKKLRHQKFFEGVDRGEVYRIIGRCKRFDYVYLRDGRFIHLTELGKGLILCLDKKSKQK